jgi:DNA polymerase-3 subunit alpha
MPNQFVHLKIHTEFSLLDGIVRIKDLIKTAGEDQQIALCITDQSNMFALIKFYNACLGAGIKPILAADLYIEREDDPANPYRMTFYAQDNKGYRNLTELVSEGFTVNQHNDKAQIKKEWFKEKGEGLIALSGFNNGDVGIALLADKQEEAEQHLDFWLSVLPNRFYLELQRTDRNVDERLEQKTLLLADKKQIPVVATNDVRFIKQDDFYAHEARVCIGEGSTLDDPRRERRYSEQQYFKTHQQMIELFKDVPSAISNTADISQRCSAQV